MVKKFVGAALFATLLSVSGFSQDANTVINNVSKAMGADNLKSITYSGTAADVNFLQTKSIRGPWPLRPITNYTRTIDLSQVASRASGATNNEGLFGGAPVPGNYTAAITPASATWTQQLDYWVTPWGFLKGAAANHATVHSQKINNKNYNVLTWSPSMKAPSGLSYTVNGYVNDQNMIDRVETWVEHDMLGDMHVDTTYSDYKDFDGVKAPAKIVQKRGGWSFFEVSIANAKPNPSDLAQLLQPPAPAAGAGGRGGAPAAPAGVGAARGAAPAAAAPAASTKLAEGVYKINGNYNALAVEFKNYIVVIEGPQSVARGDAIVAEVKRLFPAKPIRYVVNSHPHSDHASGLAPLVAAGAIIITQQNNKEFLEKTFSAPRTLLGDSLAKANKKPKVEGVAEERVLKDETRTLELYHITDPDQERLHNDGMLIALLPKEKILFQADFTLPAAGQQANPFTTSLAESVLVMRLEFDSYVSVHNTNATQTRADLMKTIGQ